MMTTQQLVGIETHGAYIPITRLPFAVIGGKAAKAGGPEKAVAWHDEDSVTMAVAAAANCLQGVNKMDVDVVILATTSLAFSEKQGASVLAKALDLTGDVKTVDISGSLRSGMLALQQAVDTVKAGSARKVLVAASDCRMGAPRSAMESKVGDGAVAFLVSAENVVATLDAFASCANEMMDVWRRQGDEFVHTWEERFINEEGYQPISIEAINTLLKKTGKSAEAFTTACISATDARNLGVVMKKAGFRAEQMQDAFFGKVGFCGAAHAPMMLAAALESAKAGDSILVCHYGDGADAFEFSVNGESSSDKRGVSFYLSRRRTVDHYNKYLAARDLTITEYPPVDDQGISATVQFRNRDENLSLQGQVCANCGTHQFPKGRICVRCGSKDDWVNYTYADCKGRVLTYTFDAFYPAPEPPTAATIIEVVLADGQPGPRIHMQFADASTKEMKTGLEVEFAFRRIHRAGKRPNYFWKCTPIQQAVNADGGAA
jgi:3-hydroxy-3-methylglutaryl CoA synthase